MAHDSIDPGGLWHVIFRWDEFPVLLAALSGRRLSADESDVAQLLVERVETIRDQIKRQATLMDEK